MEKENEAHFDPVERPEHYNQYKVEVIDLAENMNFCQGNVVKYVARYNLKGEPLQDLKKARWYLNRLIEAEKTKKGGVK